MSRIVNNNVAKSNVKRGKKTQQKMSVKMKAIISSAVAVVCVAAITLGLVFGLKKPGGKPTYKFSASQQILANEINSNVKYDVFDIVDKVPYSKYTTVENLTRYGDSYFAYKDANGNEQFYVYYKDAQGQMQTRCLTDQQGFIDTTAMSWAVEKMNGDYLVVANYYTAAKYDEEMTKIRYDVVSIKNPAEPKVIFQFDTRKMDCHVNKSDVVLEDNFFAFTYIDNINYQNQSVDYNTYFYAYSDEFIPYSPLHTNNFVGGLTQTATSRVRRVFNDNGFSIISGTKQTYYFLSNGEFYSFERDIVIDNNSQVDVEWNFIELSGSKLLVEKVSYLDDPSQKVATTIETESETELGSYTYSNKTYELFDIHDGVATNMNLAFKSGYASANKLAVSDKMTNSAYAIVYQKVDGGNKLANEYLVVYYDANGNEIVSYVTDTDTEQIVYASSNTYVTTKNILQPQNNVNTAKLFDFSNKDYYIDTHLAINGDYIVLGDSSNTKAGVIDVWGNLILDPETSGYSKILDLVDGRCVAFDVSTEKGYLVDLKSMTKTELDGYDRNPLITGSGSGLNLSKDASAQLSTIKNIYGATVAENVTDLKVPTSINGFKVIEVWTNKDNSKASAYVMFSKVGEDETSTHTSYTKADEYVTPLNNTADAYTETWSYEDYANGMLTEQEDPSYSINFTVNGYGITDTGNSWFAVKLNGTSYKLSSFKSFIGASYQSNFNSSFSVTYNNDNGATFVTAPHGYCYNFKYNYSWTFDFSCWVWIWESYADYVHKNGSFLEYWGVDHKTYFKTLKSSYTYDANVNRVNQMNTTEHTVTTDIPTTTKVSFTSPGSDTIKYGHSTHWVFSGNGTSGNMEGAGYGPGSYNNSNIAVSGYSLCNTWSLSTSGSITLGSGGEFNTYFFASYVKNTFDLYVDGSLKDDDYGVADWSSKIYYPTKTGYTFTGWSFSGFKSATHTVRYYYADGTYTDETFTGTSGTIASKTNGTYIHLRYTGGTSSYGYSAYLTANFTPKIYTIDLVFDTTRAYVNNGTSKVYYKYDYGMYLDAACTTYLMTESQNPITMPIALGYKAETSFSFTGPNGHYTPIDNEGYAWFHDDPDLYVLNVYHYNNYIERDGIRAFYSQWTPITYTVSYPSGCTLDGSNIQRSTTVTFDSVVTIPTPTGFYYDFNGFSISGASTDCTHYYGSTTAANTGNFTGATQDLKNHTSYVYFKNLWGTVDASKPSYQSHGTVTLTGNWLGKRYNVQFTMNGGNAISTINNCRYGTSYDMTSTVYRAGYNFAGWDVSGMDSVSHSITPSGGSATTFSTTTKSLGATYKNFSFSSLRGTYGSNNAVQTVTFAAKWEPITYNITYSLTNGSNEAGSWVSTEEHPATAVFEQAFGVDIPMQEGWPRGYDFAGWYITGLGDNALYCNIQNGTYLAINNTTLTLYTTVRQFFKNLADDEGDTVNFQALWTAHEYNISYVVNGTRGTLNSNSASKAAFNSYVNVYAPTRPGYTFAGWAFSELDDEITHYYKTSSATSFTSVNGKYVNSNNPNEFMLIGSGRTSIQVKNLHYVTGATVVLTAYWTPNTYNITYHYTIDADRSSYLSTDGLNTVSNQVRTKVKTAVFDQYFTTLMVGAVETDATVMAPTGHTISGWYILVGSTVAASTDIAELAEDHPTLVCDKGTDYLLNYTFVDAHLSPSASGPAHMHAYAIYTPIDITLKYYVPNDMSAPNDLSTYKFDSQVTTTFGGSVTLKNYGTTTPVTNWLVTSNLYVDGGVNYSFRTITYNSVSKYTYAGITLNWGISNTYAHDPENPVFYLYGEVNPDYDARSLSKLSFTKITDATYGDFWSVSAKSSDISGAIYIPNYYNNGTVSLPVQTIGLEGFANCGLITSVFIPRNLKVIGTEAFSCCSNMTTVSFEANSQLADINSYAFYTCTAMTSFTMPNSVSYLGSYAFQYCSSMTSLTLSTSLETLPEYFIANTSKLTSLTIPNGVVTIANYAFSYVYLTSINLPASVKSFGIQQFRNDTVATITVDTANKYYDSRNNCNAVMETATDILIVGCKNTVIPDETTQIYNSAFLLSSWMSGGTAVIPEGVTNIHNFAFDSAKFTNLILPSTLKSIGYGAFQKSSVAETIFPNGLLHLNEYAFYNTQLTKVVIPETVVWLYSYSFGNCPNLQYVYIKGGVPRIEAHAFASSSSLVSAYVPSSIGYVGANAFHGNSGATIYVGYASSSISSGWASNWYSSASVVYDNSNSATYAVLTDMYPGWDFYDSNEDFVWVIDYTGSQTSVTVPAAVDEVYLGNYFDISTGLQNVTSMYVGPNVEQFAFSGDSNVKLTTLTFSPGLKAIAMDGLSYLTKLTSVTIPYTVEYVAESVFANNPALTSIVVDSRNPYYDSRDNCNAIIWTETNSLVAGSDCSTIPNTVTSIASGAFAHVSLGNYTIPGNVKVIEDRAFVFASITSLTLQEGVADLRFDAINIVSSCTVTIPASVKSIAASAINLDKTTDNLTISVASGNTVYDSRNNCNAVIEKATNKIIIGSNLTTIPSTVTAIGQYAFKDRTLSSSFTIPSTVTVIEYGAFLRAKFTANQSINVEKIGASAFESATFAGSVTLGNKLYEIGKSAFQKATFNGQTSLEFPFLTTVIGSSAFEGVSTLTSFVFNDGIEKIGYRAFYDVKNVTTITLTNSVQEIGDYAFASMDNLTTFTFGKGLSKIPNCIFYDNLALTTFNIPESVREIGSSAFRNVKNGGDINLPDSLITIGDYAFYYYANNKSSGVNITFGKNITTIGTKAFSYASIKEIRLGDSVTSIGQEAFAYAKKLTFANFGSSPLNIESSAFYECTALVNVVFGNNLKSIGANAFYKCSALQSVDLPMSSSYTIGVSAFAYCTSIVTLEIPSNTTKVDYQAFYGCTALKYVWLKSGISTIVASSQYYSVFYACSALVAVYTDASSKPSGWSTYLNYKTTATASSMYYGKTIADYYTASHSDFTFTGTIGAIELDKYNGSASTVLIPSFVNTIGTFAFSNNTSLQKVVIPEGVTKLDGFTFNGCTALTTVILPQSLTYLGYYAFELCTSLTEIKLPSNLQYIGARTFGSTRIDTLYIPASVTQMGEAGDEQCICGNSKSSERIGNQVQHIIVDPANPVFDSRDNCDAIIETATNRLIQATVNTVIPNSVVAIGIQAYYGIELNSLTLPDSVKTLEKDAFFDTNILSITLPKVERIEDYALSSADFVTINLGDSLTYIGDYAISHTPVTSIIMPDTVTHLGEYALYSCDYLTTVKLSRGLTSIPAHLFRYSDGLTSIHIPSNITSIGQEAFYECDGLVTVNMENGLTTISESAFRNCDNLTTVNVASTLTTIGKEAFYSCKKLADFVMPMGVTSIASKAFYDCDALTHMWVPSGATVAGASTGDSPFYGCSSSLKLYTNAASRRTSWGQYWNYYNTSSACSTNYSKTYANYFSAKYTNFSTTVSGNTLILSSYTGSDSVVTIPHGITSISSSAIYNKSGVVRIIVPSSVTSISGGAFGSLSALQTLDIKEGLTQFSTDVFSGTMSALTNIYLPNTITSFNSGLSGNGTLVKKINVTLNANHPYLRTDSSGNFLIEKTTNKLLLLLNRPATTVTIPSEIVEIGDNAFAFAKLTSVVIPKNVTEIGRSAFSYVGTLTSITFEEGSKLKVIGESAFSAINFNGTVTFPEGLEVIGPQAFNGNFSSNAISFVIPSTVKSIPANFVSGTVGTITIADANPYYSDENANIILDKKTGTLISGSSSITTLPDTVKTIAAYALYARFQYISSEIDFVLPTSVKSIGSYAFSTGVQIKSIKLNAGLLAIEGYAFSSCTKITKVVLPNSLEYLDCNAFTNCASLKEVYIGNKVKKINAPDYSSSPFLSCYSTIVIYCADSSKPSGWDTYWCYKTTSGKATVVWGYNVASVQSGNVNGASATSYNITSDDLGNTGHYGNIYRDISTAGHQVSYGTSKSNKDESTEKIA